VLRAGAGAGADELQRLLFIQRYRYDGLPSCNPTSMGSVHILAVTLFEDLGRRRQPLDCEAARHLVLCAHVMKRYGDVFPAMYAVLHGLIATACRQAVVALPDEIDAIF
jgi:hypothetical protein